MPLLFAAPGFAPKRVHAPVELIDVFPTLIDLSGIAPVQAGVGQPPLAGRSLVQLMRRRPARMRIASAIAFSQWRVSRPLACMGYAVRTQGWLLIQWHIRLRERRRRPIALTRWLGLSPRLALL